MNKTKIRLLAATILFLSAVSLSNINATTKQCINYQCREYKIPLYLKLLDFYDRHYNYKRLVKNIIQGASTDEERVMRIFEWTYKNIRRNPEGFPIIDDHVWHIIVRGYGVDDQFSDVFTTLCNYSGIDAIFGFIFTKDKTSNMPLSFIRLNKRINIFDPYNGVYFVNKNGTFADINEIKSGEGRFKSIAEAQLKVNYKIYTENLVYDNIEKICLEKPRLQSPLRRIVFEAKKWMGVK